MSSATNQHRVPAALLGRFGRSPSQHRSLRDVAVGVRHLRSGRNFPSSAASIAHEIGAYDRTDGSTVDGLWEQTEQDLRARLRDLEEVARAALGSGTATLDQAAEAWSWIRDYVAEILVRHKGYDDALSALGYSRNQIQDRRVDDVDRRRVAWREHPPLTTVLVSTEPICPRLLINDWGWTYLTGAAHGFFAPLGPRLAVVVDDSSTEEVIEFTDLAPHAMDARRAMYQADTQDGIEGPRVLIGHPQDLVFKQPDD